MSGQIDPDVLRLGLEYVAACYSLAALAIADARPSPDASIPPAPAPGPRPHARTAEHPLDTDREHVVAAPWSVAH